MSHRRSPLASGLRQAGEDLYQLPEKLSKLGEIGYRQLFFQPLVARKSLCRIWVEPRWRESLLAQHERKLINEIETPSISSYVKPRTSFEPGLP